MYPFVKKILRELGVIESCTLGNTILPLET